MQRSVHGCVWVGLSLRLSHTDGSNQMFLSFKKCPGGYVCKGLLASEYSINASQLLYNSVYLSVTVLNSIYQGVGLSCTFECIFLILAKKKGLPQRYLNSFQKMHKKNPVTDLSNAINSNCFLCIPAFLCAYLNGVIELVNNKTF